MKLTIQMSGTPDRRGPWVVVRDARKLLAATDDYWKAEEMQYLLAMPCTGGHAAQLNRLLKESAPSKEVAGNVRDLLRMARLRETK